MSKSERLREINEQRDYWRHKVKLMDMTLHPGRYRTFLGFSSYARKEDQSERSWKRTLAANSPSLRQSWLDSTPKPTASRMKH